MDVISMLFDCSVTHPETERAADLDGAHPEH